MEAIHSLKGYGKVDLGEDREFRSKTGKRLIIIGVSSVLLLLLIIGAVVGLAVSRRGSSLESSPSTTDISNSIRTVCAVTRYPDSCYSSLKAATAGNTTNDPEELFKISLMIAIDGFEKIRRVPELFAAGVNNTRIRNALETCTEMIDDSINSLNDSLALLIPSRGEGLLTKSKIDTLRTYLSAVITNGETCLDGFEDLPGDFGKRLGDVLRNSTEFASNSLAIVTKIISLLGDFGVSLHRKLLGSKSVVPCWVDSDSHRRQFSEHKSVRAQCGRGSGWKWTANMSIIWYRNLQHLNLQSGSIYYSKEERGNDQKSEWRVPEVTLESDSTGSDPTLSE